MYAHVNKLNKIKYFKVSRHKKDYIQFLKHKQNFLKKKKKKEGLKQTSNVDDTTRNKN